MPFVPSLSTDGFTEYRQGRGLCGCHQAILTHVYNVCKDFLCHCDYFISYGKSEKGLPEMKTPQEKDFIDLPAGAKSSKRSNKNYWKEENTDTTWGQGFVSSEMVPGNVLYCSI